MTVSVVGTDSSSGYTDAINLTVPAGAVAGDVVLCACSTSRWPGITDPSNVTYLGEALSGTASLDTKMHVYKAVVGTDVNASDTITLGSPGSSQNFSATLICLSSDSGALDVSPSTFADGVAGLADPGDSSPIAPSIPLDGDGILVFLGSAVQAFGAVWTAPSGYTQDEDTTRTYSQQLLAHKAVSAGGSSGTATASMSGSSAWNAVHLLVAEPAPTTTEHVWDGTTWVDVSSESVWDGTAWVT